MDDYEVPRVALDMFERFAVLRTLTSARQSTDERYINSLEAAVRDDEDTM